MATCLQDPNAVDLDRYDWKKLNQRFTQTVLPKGNEDAKSAWAMASKGGSRSGKVDLQHSVLKAWVLDPSLGTFFKSQVSEITSKQGIHKEKEWISRKQLLDMFDESEAEEQIELGILQWRDHPQNPDRMQFRKVRTVETEALEAAKKVGVTGSEQIEGQNFQALNRQLDNMKVDHKAL